MPNPTPEALVAKWREAAPTREDQFNDRTNTATADTLHLCADELESALASREPAGVPKAAPGEVRQFAPASPAAPAVPDVEMARHWIDRYATGIDDECQMDRVCEALGVTLAAAQKDGA